MLVMSVSWPFCFHWHFGKATMLTLENTEEYSKSTDKYLKMFSQGLERPLASTVCQFIAKLTAVCGGGGSESRRVRGA